MDTLAPGPGETLDAIGDGEVRLLQPRDGYRFTLDSVLLAGFALGARVPDGALEVIDVGTGCGVVGLLLKARRPEWSVRGIELQPGLASLARRNAAINALAFDVTEGDLRALPVPLKGAFRLAVSNPPFFDAAAGKPCLDDERSRARHDATAGPADLARALKLLLRSNGVACAVFPARRLAELLAAWSAQRVTPTRLRLVHPREGREASVALVEGRPHSRAPLVVEPPLFVHDEAGGYRDEVVALLGRGGRLARAVGVS